MASAFDYRQLARECLQQAEASGDADRKQALREIAKLYSQTALALEAAAASPLPVGE